MPDDVPSTPKTRHYPKTGLLLAATVLPMLGWAGKQIFTGAQNALNGKSNDPVIDED